MEFDRYGKAEFFATCSRGLSGVLAEEARELGLSSVRPLVSGVSFRATVEQACRALLWIRTASRISMVLARIGASDSDELYDGIRAIDWSEHISRDTTIAVFAKGSNKELRNTGFTQMRVKDAICDSLVESCGWRPSVDAKDPDLGIGINVHESKATVSIDLSGKSMHMRGFRQPHGQVEAPIKETLAAAMLLASGWKQVAAAGGAFADPLCGSGTIAIEAAMIAGDIAPGIARPKWGIQGWKGFDQSILDRLIDEADERAEKGMASMPPIYASDVSKVAVDAAKANVKLAGLSSKVQVRKADVSGLRMQGAPASGLVASNPPYGSRIMSESQLPSLLGALDEFARSCGDWKVALVLPGDAADSAMGRAPETVVETCNGPIDVGIRVYPEPSRANGPAGSSVRETADEQAEEFANRLRKMSKHRGKWARRTGVDNYRVYDADLPDFALSVDIYTGAGRDTGRRWAYVCEYAPPKTVDPNLAASRLASAVNVVRDQFGLGGADVFVKRRVRSKGGSQYASADPAGNGAGLGAGKDAASRGHGAGGRGHSAPRERFRTIEEGGHRFLVSFEQRLDTGIFLDGRLIRQMLEEMAAGKSFLNLFAYTGTATVYAASGGAKSTHTVDISQNYLDWAKENMRANGLKGDEHTFERADVLSWIDDTRHSPRRFDLVYVDPPTFSNSKKMRSKSWDVQRDHAELLIAVSRILSPEGKAVFCCNLRGFKPDMDTLTRAGVALEDISARTIPADFERNAKVHHCYIVTRTAPSGVPSGATRPV